MQNVTLLLLCLSTLLAACGERAEEAAPATGEGPFSHLEEVVRIGAIGGDGPDVFGRIADVEIGPDRNVYALDQQAAEVRVFDLDGHHVRTIGGKGGGPGELQSPNRLAFDEAGRLWVGDGDRYTLFGPGGELLETHTTAIRGGLRAGQFRAGAGGVVFDLAWLMERRDGADGSIRVRGLGPGAVVWALEEPPVLRDSVAFGNEWRPASLTRTRGGETVSMVIPRSPQRLFELSPTGTVWTGTSDEYAVHAVSLEGDTVMTVRRPVQPRPLRAGDEQSLHRWASRMREQGFSFDDAELPKHYPFFDRIIAADDGTLWVYRNWGEGGAFDIFDRNGRYLGEVPTRLDAGPFGTHPSISNGYIAGVATDSLDVPRVEVHRIVRP